MRRIVSIFILSVFVYNTFGFLALHPLLSVYYKHLGMKRADKPSEEEMVEILAFEKEEILNGEIDFRWINSREFKYSGDMYDIVKKAETDKQLVIYCINDTKEKKLEEEFEKRVHRNTNEDKQHPAANNHFNILISEPVKPDEVSMALGYEYTYNFWLTDYYKSIHFDIPSPPPRVV